MIVLAFGFDGPRERQRKERVRNERLDRAGLRVDEAATASLREQMRADRPDQLPTFDMGPPIEEILARALEETGLPAPTAPRPL